MQDLHRIKSETLVQTQAGMELAGLIGATPLPLRLWIIGAGVMTGSISSTGRSVDVSLQYQFNHLLSQSPQLYLLFHQEILQMEPTTACGSIMILARDLIGFVPLSL